MACEAFSSPPYELGLIRRSTPLYQVAAHALADPKNKTKFKLIFANVSEADIIMRDELDALKKAHPDTFDIVYAVDKAGPDFKGAFSAALIDIIC